MYSIDYRCSNNNNCWNYYNGTCYENDSSRNYNSRQND